jgi:hypothetical protein
LKIGIEISKTGLKNIAILQVAYFPVFARVVCYFSNKKPPLKIAFSKINIPKVVVQLEIYVFDKLE